MTVEATHVLNPGLVRALLHQDPEAIQGELRHATLLVPAAQVAPDAAAVRHGRAADGRPLLWAFTDTEALGAWDHQPAQSAAVLAARELGSLEQARGAMIALNPAGPGAFLVGSEALPVHEVNGHTSELLDTGGLVGSDARALVRRRAREAHRRGLEAAAEHRLSDARAEFELAVDACGELGDRLHGAAAALDLAACLNRSGELDSALATWERAAEVLAVFGERDLAVSGWLDAAEAAAGAGRAEEAERLSVAALELCVGTELSDRLVSLWRRIGGD